ncbi:hypothetical protein D917_02397 [Trichinella nativa]|uniref:Uncharacterized protein n=1 Tax=Trichinella nativa TaxID=6335 RepID=A0A1Y3EFL7_9BILA|nr:hypothetical protein D917_02397 [Trichinella nativa]
MPGGCEQGENICQQVAWPKRSSKLERENYPSIKSAVKKFKVCSQTDSRCNWELLDRFIYSSTLSGRSIKLARLVENSPCQSANGGVDSSAPFLLAIQFWHKFPRHKNPVQ